MSVTETFPVAAEPYRDATPLLAVEDLHVHYRQPGFRSPPLRAVDGVSFTIGGGETVGLVGESGSGKSTIGRAVLGLVPVSRGVIRFAGRDITHASVRARRELSRELQVVFQDPYGSLNPSRTVGQTLAEPVLVHEHPSKRDVRDRVQAALARVGLGADAAERYPSNFSGGQRQRIAIARALVLAPRLVICDEPVSSLDLSIQAQILNLLAGLQAELSLSYLFVSHDLAVVRHAARRVLVMYRGLIMEEGPASVVCSTPAHPYTQALLAAVPVPDPVQQHARRAARAGLVRSATADSPMGDGCPFAGRCPHVIDECRVARPALVPSAGGTTAACVRLAEIASPADHLEISRAQSMEEHR